MAKKKAAKNKAPRLKPPKPATGKRTKRTAKKKEPKWAALFLDGLRKYGTVTHACEAAGIGRTAAYEYRKRSEDFARSWDEANLGAVEDLERSVFFRAKFGWKQEVYFQGLQVGTRTVFSPQLATFILAAKKPELYSRAARHGELDSAPTDDTHEVQFFPDSVAASAAADNKGDE